MRALHIGLALAGAAAVATPALLVGQAASPAAAPPAGDVIAAMGWRDVVAGQRAPQVPPAGDTESAIVLLDGPGLVDVPPAERAGALARMQQAQLALEGSVQGMGGVVTHRYRTLVNGLAVRIPAGRMATLGEVAGIQAVVPVLYMAPAASDPGAAVPVAAGGQQAAPPAARAPEHIALIDTGVDASHPWLGGGIGPDRLIIGGADLVEGDADPAPDPANPGAEAHGTQMASIILRSPALAGLPPEAMPRLLAYRVTAREEVDGHVRTLARTDRVLAALEMAVDPDRDGLPSDA
ncbi:MAG: S8 family serine peptidase, partial [Thermoleophilia bacterium]